ncbi:MAG TPA: hypothetical protein VLJ11_16980 [Bryobacteraceae bacterium]|nr:hypothetical protein [Bryobacteraceae bacterium]
MRLTLLLLYLFFGSFVRAELLPNALETFPANTVSLERDNLAMLRQLPNYGELRKQYSSDSLQRVKGTLLALGISEDQLSEVVTASGPGGFFGLVSGKFQSAAVARKAAGQKFQRTALGTGSAYCSPDNLCVFLSGRNDGNASFATLDQLRAMLAVRQGQAPSVKSNSSYMSILAEMDLHAPVVGLAPGSEITQLVKDAVPQELSSRFDLSQWFSRVESLGYSIRIDASAHLNVHLLCKSESDSKLLSNTLNAAGGLQRMAALAVGNAWSFRNLSATPSGRMVELKFDAALGQ